jgi:hypothetical protein
VIVQQVAELGHGSWPVLLAHALDTSTDADIDHASVDGIRNVDDRHRPTATLPIQALHSCRSREAGCQGSSTVLGGSASWSEHTSYGDVVDELGIDM